MGNIRSRQRNQRVQEINNELLLLENNIKDAITNIKIQEQKLSELYSYSDFIIPIKNEEEYSIVIDKYFIMEIRHKAEIENIDKCINMQYENGCDNRIITILENKKLHLSNFHSCKLLYSIYHQRLFTCNKLKSLKQKKRWF